MNANSLKSRQLLAALRTLPECRPHNVNGVSAYVEAADKVEELERALGVLRQNMDAAVGTIAQAVRMAWKGAEITQSVWTVLNLPVPQWAQAHGWDYAVPEWLSSEERLVYREGGRTMKHVTMIHPKVAACDLCGKVEELRPYGPNGESVCFDCAMKDEEAAKRQLAKLLSGQDVFIIADVKSPNASVSDGAAPFAPRPGSETPK